MTTTMERTARRTVAVPAAVVLAVAGLLATPAPASADTPEGWPQEPDVDLLQALLVLGGIPLLLFIGIAVAVYIPSLVRGDRLTPGAPAGEDQWIGGSRTGARELTGATAPADASATPSSPDTPHSSDSGSDAGGASARW